MTSQSLKPVGHQGPHSFHFDLVHETIKLEVQFKVDSVDRVPRFTTLKAFEKLKKHKSASSIKVMALFAEDIGQAQAVTDNSFLGIVK